MKKNVFSFFLLLLALFFLAASAQAVDKYWVGFNGTGGVFKYLMQIDQSGNITIPPTEILSYDKLDFVSTPEGSNGEPADPYGDPGGENVDLSGFEGPRGPIDGPCAIALTDSGANINYYILTSQGSLFKFTVNKSTVKPTNDKPTPILARGRALNTSDFRTLQATQHTENRYVAMTYGDIGKDTSGGLDNIKGRLTAFGLNSQGKLDGTDKRIVPSTDGASKMGSVSADGLMAISNVEQSPFDDDGSCARDNDTEKYIVSQPLDSLRRPVGDIKVIGNTGAQVGAVDVTNPLGGGKRFVLYATRSADEPDTQNGDDLVVQAIDSATGDKIGTKKILQQDIEMVLTSFQGVAIDPLGRFVLFAKRPVKSTSKVCTTACSNGCNDDDPGGEHLQLNNRDSLYYLALAPDGSASGSPIQIFSAEDGFQTGAEDEALDTGTVGPRICQECAIPQVNGIDILMD